MTALTIPGLVLGLAAGVVVPPLVTLALRAAGAGAILTVLLPPLAAVLAALALGAWEGEPSAAMGATLIAPGVQALLVPFAAPRALGWRWLAAGLGAAWLLGLFLVFGGGL